MSRKSSQSALEYMMTYGWAILIIVIVAGVLYSLGIFNPSASASTTVTGFSSLGSVQAACGSNGVLRLQIGDDTGYTINVTTINATSNANLIVVRPNITITPNSVAYFSVPSICAGAGSRYSASATLAYKEIGTPFSGPFFSVGTVSGLVTSNTFPASVGLFNNKSSYLNATFAGLPTGASTRTVILWINTNIPFSAPTVHLAFGYGVESADEAFQFFSGNSFSNPAVTAWSTDQHFGGTQAQGLWYMVAFEYNSTWQIGYIENPNGTSLSVSSKVTLNTQNSPFIIGAAPNGFTVFDGRYWSGFISNVQLYSSSLSAAQITQILNSGLGGAPLSGAGLIAWWPLNGTAKDFSGNGHNGINNNVVFTSNYKSP